MTDSMNDYNQKIIDEFRANQGKVGGPFEGATMLLLTHTGRKSAKQRTNPLVTMPDGDRYIIFASKGGAPEDPDWFGNIKANSRVTVEVGADKFDAVAEEITGNERDRLWRKNVSERPAFGEYEQRTDRTIPVVALRRA